jgi:hypothetical protein
MSGRKLQGKRRTEVIEKWLKGEEDPEWQVRPTKTDGKYIISERKPAVSSNQSDEAESEGQDQDPEQEQEPEEKEEVAKPKPVEKPPPPPPKPKPKPKDKPYPREKLPKSAFSDDVAVEILTELRAIGEAKRTKQAKREQKKEIKRQVRKHTPAQQPIFVDDEEYEYDEPPPQPTYPQRRRVNLLRPA